MTRSAQSSTTFRLTPTQRAIKRTFDIVIALIGLSLAGCVIVPAAMWARRETGRSGIFRQPRIGRDGRVFYIYKIRTMRDENGPSTTVTTARDPRITRIGAVLRRWKIDELPQLINVLRGEMSLVGPRPDVPAYLDQIRRHAPLVLSVQPGITGPASIKYRHEEQLLAAQVDPQSFNDHILFPDKLRINEAYVRNYQFITDIKFLWATVFERGRVDTSQRAAIHDGHHLKAA